MTDAERLEWACEVWNREKHGGRTDWTLPEFVRPEFNLATDDQDGQAWSIVAIAIALDEQARRKLPMSEQAEWAAAELSRRKHAGCVAWKRVGTCVDATDLVGYYASTAVCALSKEDAAAIAESLIRREMLGDTP